MVGSSLFGGDERRARFGSRSWDTGHGRTLAPGENSSSARPWGREDSSSARPWGREDSSSARGPWGREDSSSAQRPWARPPSEGWPAAWSGEPQAIPGESANVPSAGVAPEPSSAALHGRGAAWLAGWDRSGSGDGWPELWRAGVVVLGIAGVIGVVALMSVAAGATLLDVGHGMVLGAIVALAFGSIGAVALGKQIVVGRKSRSTGTAVAGFVLGWVGLALVAFDALVFVLLIRMLDPGGAH